MVLFCPGINIALLSCGNKGGVKDDHFWERNAMKKTVLTGLLIATLFRNTSSAN